MLTKTLRLSVALSVVVSSAGGVPSAAEPVGGGCWDLRNFARFQREFTGPALTTVPVVNDLDLDGRVGLSDYPHFLHSCEVEEPAPQPLEPQRPTHPLGRILLWLLFMLVLFIAATHDGDRERRYE